MMISKAAPPERAVLRRFPPRMCPLGWNGLTLLWVTGVALVYTKYGGFEALPRQVYAVPTADLRAAFARGGRSEVLRAQLSGPVARRLPSDRARWHAELGQLDATFRDLDDECCLRCRVPRAAPDAAHAGLPARQAAPAARTWRMPCWIAANSC